MMLIAVELYLQIIYNFLVVFQRLHTFDPVELKDLHYQYQVVQLKDSLVDLAFEFPLFDLLFPI